MVSGWYSTAGTMSKVQQKNDKTRQRYNRIAPFFDVLEAFFEGMYFSDLRKTVWHKVKGEHVLEVGVGTGKNFPFYPANSRITALDFSEGMLKKAKRKRQRKEIAVELELMDVQSLCYADNSFDTVIATFVFCSVPMPIKGLQELHRVCKPGGQVLLLEHVLSSQPMMAKMMQLMNPVIAALFGANINRQTVKSVQSCGFQKVLLDPASSDMVKVIQAIK